MNDSDESMEIISTHYNRLADATFSKLGVAPSPFRMIGVSIVFFLWQNPYTCVRNMCVPKERMKDLHLAAGGRG
jgi:hypothetical protein